MLQPHQLNSLCPGASGLWHNLCFPLTITLFAEFSLLSYLSFKTRPLSWTFPLHECLYSWFSPCAVTSEHHSAETRADPASQGHSKVVAVRPPGNICQPLGKLMTEEGRKGHGAQGAFLPFFFFFKSYNCLGPKMNIIQARFIIVCSLFFIFCFFFF